MRKHKPRWTLLPSALIAVSACDSTVGVDDFERDDVFGSGIVVTEARIVASFTGVRASGGHTVVVEQVEVEGVKVTTDDNLVTFVWTDVIDGTLVVSIDPRVRLRPTEPARRSNSRARDFDADRKRGCLPRRRHRVGARVDRPRERRLAGACDRVGGVADFTDQWCQHVPRARCREQRGRSHGVGRERGRTLGARPTRGGWKRCGQHPLSREPERDRTDGGGIDGGACSLS